LSINLFLHLSKLTIAIFIFQSVLLYGLKFIGLYDHPNHRKIHIDPKLTGGGLLFILSWIFFSGFGGVLNNLYLFIAFIVIILLGFFDDIKMFSAKIKLIIHSLTGFLMFLGNGGFTEFFGIENNIVLCIVTIIYYVSFINIVNLIDGADGLAVIICSIILIGVIILGINYVFAFDIILLVLSLLVFLVWNIKNSVIFMGDCGSNFLGFIIAFYILKTGFSVFSYNLFIPFIFLIFLPFIDTLLAIIRRLKNKKSIFAPDKEHIHHILIKKFGLNRALIILSTVQLLFTSISLIILRGNLW